ncbi:MAG: Asp-tRNA(Asn)/Glu-tRNA(Gln) amidotransferase subunit GatA [Elusimicrobiota bacterium]
MSILELTATELAGQVQSGSLDPESALDAYFGEIQKSESHLKAFLLLMRESAYAQARSLRAKRAEGRTLGRLAGVPMAVKDNLLIEGFPVTCGSRILQGYRSSYTATVVERLIREDAIVIGKTNLDEFAMGSSTENSAFQITRNPWDLERVPGGSSGGSAAAVAGSMALAALGSDTGGSIRQPAGLCGLVGFKPTYGFVSRYGLVAFASSLDQVGPLARTAADAALVFGVIAGHDPKDSTSLVSSNEMNAHGLELPKDLNNVVVGVPKEFADASGVDPEVTQALEKTLEVFRSRGARVRSVTLPHVKFALAAYYVLAPSEASANLARFDGVRYGNRASERESARAADADSGEGELIGLYKRSRTEGFGREVQRRILIGTFALSQGYYEAYYGKAQRARGLIVQDFEKAFGECQILLAPTAPTPAFKVGEKTDDPVAMYLSDVFTIPVNIAGIPAVSFPCGFSRAGLPIGAQLMGPKGSDRRLLALAQFFEEATEKAFIRRPSMGKAKKATEARE